MLRLKAASSAVAAATLLAANVIAAPTAMAIAPPVIDPAALPPAETPGPTEEMRQSEQCINPVVIADPDVTQPPPGNVMLNIKQAWQYSTGAGVPVAIIDTGVTANPRFPQLYPGGDYVQGLENGGVNGGDCENHGTVIASIIAGAPSNPADRPAPKPAGVAPWAPPPPVPANPAPTSPPPPPPPAQTVTVIAPPPPPPPAPAPPPPPPGDAPADGPPAPGSAQPLVPGPPPGGPDGVVGVAPDAALISIRQSSVAFSPAHPTQQEQEEHRRAGDIMTLAKAIRTAADLGAKVINVSLASCTNAAAPVNQDPLGAAVRYAAVEKDAVIVAAAGNKNDPMQTGPGQNDCGQNPAYNPLNVNDPRDWNGVRTIVSPAWFSDYVLSVAAVTPEGVPMPDSINGPWVGVAAPGTRIMGLSSTNGAAVNASLGKDPGTGNGIWGTSFSAAYVSGVAALVRAKYPNLTAHQVIRRIMETAHNPAHTVDNQVGYGVVDPVAALTFDVAPGDPKPVEHLTTALRVPPPPPAPDTRARSIALLGTGAAILIVAVLGGIAVIRRRMT